MYFLATIFSIKPLKNMKGCEAIHSAVAKLSTHYLSLNIQNVPITLSSTVASFAFPATNAQHNWQPLTSDPEHIIPAILN